MDQQKSSSGQLGRVVVLTARTRLLNSVANLLVSLWVTPVMLAFLGPVVFGAWSVASRALGFTGYASLNPLAVLRITLGLEHASTDEARKRRLVGAAVIQTVAAAPLIIALGWFVTSRAVLIDGLAPADLAPLRAACWIMVMGFCLNEITAIGSAITTGQNIAFKAMGWSTLAIIASGGLRVWGLNMSWGVIGLSIATVAGMLINNVVQWGVALKHVPWLGVAWPLRDEVRGSLLIGAKNVVAAGLKMLILSGDLLLVGWALGAEASATYAAAGIVVRILLEPVGGIVIPAFGPSLKILTGCGRRGETNLLRIEIIAFSLSIMGLLGGAVILVGHATLPEFEQ